MKKALLILFLILYSLIVFSQQSIINDTLKPFSSSFPIRSVCEDDSFYYFIGGVNNAIVKTDKLLNIIQKKRVNPVGYYFQAYPYNSVLIDDNKIVSCGIATDTMNNEFGVILAYNKNTLDTLWLKKISHPDTTAASQVGADVFSGLTAIKTTPDGGYILTGNYNKNCVTGDLRSFLLKIDSVGNVEWRKTYNDIYKLLRCSIKYLF